MALAFAEIAFTPAVRARQDRLGSGRYAAFLAEERQGGDRLGAAEREFIEDRDGTLAERLVMIHVEAFDWNCPRHIPRRFTMAEAHMALTDLQTEIKALRRAEPQAATPKS